jgi:hypothetical protein
MSQSRVKSVDERREPDTLENLQPSPEELREILLEARRKLPESDRRYERAMKDAYRRAGIPPLPEWSSD